MSDEEDINQSLIINNKLVQHDMTVKDYNDKSVVIRSNDSELYRENLIQIGCNWHRNLRGGPGWIFPKNRIESLNQFLNDVSRGVIKSIKFSKSKEVILLVVGDI